MFYKWKNIKWRAFIIYRWILTKFSRQRWYDTSSLNRIPFLTKFYGTEYSKSKTEYLANLKMLAKPWPNIFNSFVQLFTFQRWLLFHVLTYIYAKWRSKWIMAYVNKIKWDKEWPTHKMWDAQKAWSYLHRQNFVPNKSRNFIFFMRMHFLCEFYIFTELCIYTILSY